MFLQLNGRQSFEYAGNPCKVTGRGETREPETMEFCYKVLGRTRCKYTALEPYPEFLHTRPRTVKPDWVFGPSALGQAVHWPEPFMREPSQEVREFGTDWCITVQRLLDCLSVFCYLYDMEVNMDPRKTRCAVFRRHRRYTPS